MQLDIWTDVQTNTDNAVRYVDRCIYKCREMHKDRKHKFIRLNEQLNLFTYLYMYVLNNQLIMILDASFVYREISSNE